MVTHAHDDSQRSARFAGKVAVHGLVRSAAAYGGPLGIRVNAVAPVDEAIYGTYWRTEG